MIKASPSTIIICPPNSVTAICTDDRKVELSAIAPVVDSEDELLFTWNVTAGKLSGEGRKVIWDLSSVAEGVYTATVQVNDANQLSATDSTKVTIAVCSSCDPPPPPCPVISVSCSDIIKPKPSLTFEAKVAGGDPEMKPTYTWIVSAGKIISGQGTSKIVVDVSHLVIQPVTAIVSLGGADPSCSRITAACTTPLASSQRY